MSLGKNNGDRGFARGIRNRGSRFSLNTERYRKEGSRGREKTARGGRNVGEKREKTQNYLVQGRTGSGVFSLHVINILNGLFLYEFFLIVEFRIKGNFLKKLRLVCPYVIGHLGESVLTDLSHIPIVLIYILHIAA